MDTTKDNLIQKKTISEETSKCTVQLAKLARNAVIATCGGNLKLLAVKGVVESGPVCSWKTCGFSNGALNGGLVVNNM